MRQSRIDEALLHCLLSVPDETGDGRLEALSSADWDAFVEASGRHGVAPLLYRRLRTSHPGAPVPADVMERLRLAYLESAARNMGLYQELGKALELLRRDNLPVIVLKGAHLAALVYGNPALRPMGDVDLLVHENDLLRVEAVLLGLGYTPLEHDRSVSKDNKHFVYVLSKRRLCVEVHWTIAPSMSSFDMDIGGQWERASRAVVAGVEVAVLCPEDLLLHLCLHTCEHNCALGLRSVCDIAESLRHYRGGIDWELVERRSRQSGMGKCVYTTLRLAKELLGVVVPDGLMEALEPADRDDRLIAVARAQVFSAGMERGHAAVATLWSSERLEDKTASLVRIARVVFPARAALAREYPARSDSVRIYFCYALHLRDLLRRHGRHLWRLLRGDAEMQALARREDDIAALRDWLGFA